MAREVSKVMEQETVRVKSLTFHPNKPIIISGHHNGVIKAWDYQMNVCVHDFLGHDGSVRVVLFHPRGDFFVSGGDDKTIRIWNYTERRITNRLEGHEDYVRSLDFHPTKPWILSASDDQTVMIWNMLTGKLLATARGHCHYVMSAKFLGENLIVSGSLDQTIRIWDCKGLNDTTKKSSLLPDVVVKQIVDGHDRGVNSVCVGDGVFVSGGDDRDVKIWEWSETSCWEKEVVCNHQGPVTGLLCSGRYILSSGEDGLFSVFDVERRKSVHKRVDGRYWCVAERGDFCAAGHDSGFDVYLHVEPKVVCTSNDGLFYLKGSKMYFSDYMTERILYRPKKDIVCICSEGDYLLIQYEDRFEVLDDGKMVFSESGEGVLFSDCDGVGLILKVAESIYRTRIGSKEKKILSTAKGRLFRGTDDMVLVINEKHVTLCFMDGRERHLSGAFKPLKVRCSNDRIALLGLNDISIYDLNLNSINNVNEMVSVIDGFFYEDVFIYSTYKHLKYVFDDRGVLKSVDKIVVPFSLENNMLYFLSDGIECTEVDMTEIKFKKVVTEDKDVAPFIEGGALPGLAPLSYLIKRKKGRVALPYIKDNRQRFELCLSDSRLDECMEYCRIEGDLEMNRRLAEVAIRECRTDIAEECLRSTKEWNMLFMLYVCDRRDDKLREIVNNVDEATKSAIMLYMENKDYFKDIGVVGGAKDGNLRVKQSNRSRNEFNLLALNDVDKDSTVFKGISVLEDKSPMIHGGSRESVESVGAFEHESCEDHDDYRESGEMFSNLSHEFIDNSTASSLASCNSEEVASEAFLAPDCEELCWSGEKSEDVDLDQLSLKEEVIPEVSPINDSALAGYTERTSDRKSDIRDGLMFTTQGKFSKAVQMFRNAILDIAFEIKDGKDYKLCTEERRMLGAYISGLLVERARRRIECPMKNIMMVSYFASLPLEKEHRILASSTAIMVLRKHGNFKQAKELANKLQNEAGNVKAVSRALSERDPRDEHILPQGIFCHDVMEIMDRCKTCLLCFVSSSEGDVCTNCEVGTLR